SLDCDYVAQLWNDPDPQIQMQTFSFLLVIEKTNHAEVCADQVVSAFAIMVTNGPDASALRSAIAYVAIKPQRIHANLDSITTLMEKTSDEDLQLECESLLFALPSGEMLPPRTCQALESLRTRSAADSEVHREAATLLATRTAVSKK